MTIDRDIIKKDFGGQALNRYERVCAALARYRKLYGNPDNGLIDMASDAILDSNCMRDFIKLMPKRVPPPTKGICP